MSESNKQTVNEVTETVRALWFDLPIASLRWGFGMSSRDDFAAVAWKGYDAGVKLASDFIVGLVKSPVLNEIAANASIANFRAQKIVDQVSGRAAERKIASLQGQLNSLTEEIEDLREARIVTHPSQRRIASVGSRKAKREAAASAVRSQLAVA